MQLRTITDCQPEQLTDRYVVVRSSLNVPLADDGQPRSTYRIEQALPTLRYLHEAGAKVIVMAHIGSDGESSLRSVADMLGQYLPVHWGGAIGSDESYQRRNLLGRGDILVLENTRAHEGEKANEEQFAKLLAGYGEIFVMDAFAVAHREHASTVGVASVLPSYAGLTLAREVHELTRAMEPRSPSLFLLGGAKFSTKLPLVTKYLDTYSGVFIGGALANDLLRARGYPVGQSMMSDVADAMLAFKDHPSLLLPVDVVVSTERDGASRRTCGLAEVEPDEMILDAGPKTIAMLRPHITTAQTILWNGPLGNYEDGYTEGTEALAATIAESRADSIVGGGDTVAAIEQLNINTKFTHVSTGGGAMLALLESGTLPALEPLRT